jgi:uncharacterized protein
MTPDGGWQWRTEGTVKDLAPGELLLDGRRCWQDTRRHLEKRLIHHGERHTPAGPRRSLLMSLAIPLVGPAFRLMGLYRRGASNARDVRLTEVEFAFHDLPEAFDGYTVLFLTDLHVSVGTGHLDRAAELAAALSCDAVVLGGDYQEHGVPGAAEAARRMAPLLGSLKAADRVFAVLGNHDRHDMAAALEGLGVRVLLNEAATVERGGQRIHLIGCDDVHAFYSAAADAALHRHPEGFRIAVVHSADFATRAADAGCALYLAGHTHGGQVCLPGGRPVLTALDDHRRLARGAWHWRGMQGYTSTGLGSGNPPLRFNCPAEVAVVRLRRRHSPSHP